jgi:universal stress protein E
MSESAADLNLFVVIDPSQEPQPALDQAIRIGETAGVRVHLFVCIFDQAIESGPKDGRESGREAMIERNRQWLEVLARPLTDRGTPVTMSIDWDSEWREAIVRAVQERRPDLVVKSTFKHSRTSRTLFKSSDRLLLRHCGCPVLLVKSGQAWTHGKVLGCLTPKPKDIGHGELNEAVIKATRSFADRHGSPAHFVLVADSSEDLPDARELGAAVGVPRNQIHITQGAPAEAIIDAAKRLDVDVIVIGTIARSGAAGLVIGNTAERVLDRVDVDVLAVPRRDAG